MESFEKYLIEQIPNIDISTIHIGLLNDLKYYIRKRKNMRIKLKNCLNKV